MDAAIPLTPEELSISLISPKLEPQTAYKGLLYLVIGRLVRSGFHIVTPGVIPWPHIPMMPPRRFESSVMERDSYFSFPERIENEETQGGVGYLVVPIPNNGNHMVEQVNDHQEATKFKFKDEILTMLMLTMIFTFMAALMSASIENPHQASIATRSFLWCNSSAFVASLAGVIYLLHEFPLKPWSHITVSLLFIPYMLLVFKISPDDTCPLLFLSIPILLFAAARELCGFTD